jgi:hypothetical protein
VPCHAAQLHDALSGHVNVRFHLLGDFVEKLVQADEVRAFDVPVRLLQLHLEIYRIGEALVDQRVQFRSRWLGQVIFGFVHGGRFCCFAGSCFHGVNVLTHKCPRRAFIGSPSTMMITFINFIVFI